MFQFLVDLPASIRSSFSGSIDAFSASRDWASLLGVLPLGIDFGMANAPTPGHGESVLAAYAAGSGLNRRRVLLTAIVLAVQHTRLTRPAEAGPSDDLLSVLQRQVLVWVARGKSNSDIAIIMGLSARAVGYHVSEILRKLGVATRAQAAARLTRDPKLGA